jgi:hypothetical protein
MTRREPPSSRLKSSKQLSDQFSKGEFRPSEYMRARRLELFSDSRVESQSLLGRELFEYHLETPPRKSGTEFESSHRSSQERDRSC